MEEQWKDVAGWEGYYQISNLGNVRSVDRVISWNGTTRLLRGKPMVPVIGTDGYLMIKFTRNNKATTYGIHRIVAQNFIDNPDNLPEVNHIDCDRTNNAVSNLEWSTHSENIGHSRDLGHYRHYGSENQNYGKHTLHEYYMLHPDKAIENLARPGSQNGRSRRVIMYDMNHVEVCRCDWIGGCAEYLRDNGYANASINSIRTRIRVSINNNSCSYKHYYKFA